MNPDVSPLVRTAIVGDSDLCSVVRERVARSSVLELIPSIKRVELPDQVEADLVFTALTTALGAGRGRAPGSFCIDLTGQGDAPLVPTVDEVGRAGERMVCVAPAPAQIAAPVVCGLSGVLHPIYVETATILAAASLGSDDPAAELERLGTGTERALERVGEAHRAKALTFVSPADPPAAMRTTIYIVAADEFDASAAEGAVDAALDRLQRYAPRCRRLGGIVLARRQTPWGLCRTLTLGLEAEAGEGLPGHTGNLDLVAIAALALGEALSNRPRDGRRR